MYSTNKKSFWTIKNIPAPENSEIMTDQDGMSAGVTALEFCAVDGEGVRVNNWSWICTLGIAVAS